MSQNTDSFCSTETFPHYKHLRHIEGIVKQCFIEKINQSYI